MGNENTVVIIQLNLDHITTAIHAVVTYSQLFVFNRTTYKLVSVAVGTRMNWVLRSVCKWTQIFHSDIFEMET